MKRRVALALVFMLAGCFIVSTVQATSQTFTVSLLAQKEFTFNLNKGEIVSGEISAASSQDINLIIASPNGDCLASYSKISSQSFSFTAETAGAYILTLDNSYSLSSKTVTINYSVQGGVLGVPQNIIILLAVVVAVMVAAVLIIRYNMHKPKNSILNSNEMNFFTYNQTLKEAAVVVYCPKCGAQNGNDVLFCKKCGKKLT